MGIGPPANQGVSPLIVWKNIFQKSHSSWPLCNCTRSVSEIKKMEFSNFQIFIEPEFKFRYKENTIRDGDDYWLQILCANGQHLTVSEDHPVLENWCKACKYQL